MALRSAIIVDVFAVEGVNLARQVTRGTRNQSDTQSDE